MTDQWWVDTRTAIAAKIAPTVGWYGEDDAANEAIDMVRERLAADGLVIVKADEYEALKDWVAKEAELIDDVTGRDVVRPMTERINKLYMALNAKARGDENDLDGDPALPWNRLVGATAYAFAKAVVNARWAVNEHRRVEQLEAEVARLRAVVEGDK